MFNRDHSTILYGIQSTEDRIATGQITAGELERIEAQCLAELQVAKTTSRQ